MVQFTKQNDLHLLIQQVNSETSENSTHYKILMSVSWIIYELLSLTFPKLYLFLSFQY